MRADLEHGARYVITEARESGTSGICRPDGPCALASSKRSWRPTCAQTGSSSSPDKSLQTYFIKRVGPDVNLANIALSDPIALETLRLGLRGDTLLALDAYIS